MWHLAARGVGCGATKNQVVDACLVSAPINRYLAVAVEGPAMRPKRTPPL
jgi:hypothetical protein